MCALFCMYEFVKRRAMLWLCTDGEGGGDKDGRICNTKDGLLLRAVYKMLQNYKQ